MKTNTPFAQQLMQARRAARLSQLALSLRAGVSQRHLSCLESSRAAPGRQVVVELGRALELSFAAQRELLEAAGFSAAVPQSPPSAETLAAVHEAAERMLQKHEPYPAVLMDRAYHRLRCNRGFDALLSRVAPAEIMWERTRGRGPPNLLKLSLHAEGLRPHVVDFPSYASAVLVRAERAALGFPALREVLAELREDPVLDRIYRNPTPLDAVQTGPAWMETYLLDGAPLKLFSVQASVGIPMDAMAESLLLEYYFPGDAATARLLDETGHQPASVY